MIPVHRYLNPYPQHGNQMSSPSHCQPIPHSCRPWPCGNGFGYPVPCNACGGYANMPGHYGFSPAFSPISPPLYQCCGHHVPFGEYFPPQYVPPSHYSMDKPRYEYDKGASVVHDNHCLGWAGHTHNQRRDDSVKVEELEPDAQKKGGDSLIPFQWRNYPYPVVWVPPEYMNNKGHDEPVARDQTSVEKNSQDMRSQSYPVFWIPPEYMGNKEEKVPMTQVPVKEEKNAQKMTNYPYPIVWIPPEHVKNGKPKEFLAHEPVKEEKNSQYTRPFGSFRVPDSGCLMQDDNGQKTQDKENEEKMQQFPFPIIWIPSYNERDESQKDDPQETKSSYVPAGDPGCFTKSSLKASNGNNCLTQSHIGFDNSNDHVNVEGKGSRCIPVKQMEEPRGEKQSPEDTGRRGKVGCDKDAVQIMGGEAPGSDKRKCPSSPRTSKLPPVCLRVDPLPKTKKGKASSRSPSPPGAQGRSHEPSKGNMQASSCELQASNQDSQTQNVELRSINDLEDKKEEGNVVELKECTTTEKNKEADKRPQTQSPPDLSEALKRPETRKSGKNVVDGLQPVKDPTTEEFKGTKEETDTAKTVGDELKSSRKLLSDEEAALLIQSAFRGFEVRRLEPLQKLKQLAGVREQVAELRTKIQSMKSSSDLLDDKQRVLIGEMVMTLLLKLDAIQGVNQDIRDIRKSIARELVSLQQELDSVPDNKSDVKKDSSEYPLYDSGNNIVDNMESMDGPSESGFEMMVGTNCDHTNKRSSAPTLEMEGELAGSKNDCIEMPAMGVGGLMVEQECKDGDGELQSKELIETRCETLGASPIDETPPSTLKGDAKEEKEISEEDSWTQSATDKPVDETETRGVLVSPDASGLQDLQREIKDTACDAFISKEENSRILSGAIEEKETTNVVIGSGPNYLQKSEEEMRDQASDLCSQVTENIGPEMLTLNYGEKMSKDLSDDLKVEPLEAAKDNAEVRKYMESNEEAVNEESDKLEKSGEEENLVEPGDSVHVEMTNASSGSDEVLMLGEPEELQTGLLDPIETNYLVRTTSEKDRGGWADTRLETDMLASMARQEKAQEGQDENVAIETCAPSGQTDMVSDSQANEVKIGEASDNEYTAVDKEEAPKESENQLCVLVADADYVAAKSQVSSDDDKEEDLLPVSSLASPLSMEEHAARMGSDSKLVEENERLREMMEKLVETGKEQLAVISDLTGRVKDLEKKLSKKNS